MSEVTDNDVKILAAKLAGSYKPNANDIRRNARNNFSKGRVASGFARNTGTGSAKAGDILATCITAERLGNIAQDSPTDIYLQRMYGSNKSKPTNPPVESPEFIEREFQPVTSKLDKPSTALNLQETNALYAKRRRAS